MGTSPDTAAADLAPTGVIRAAINTANIVLARKDPKGGDPTGVSVDLARAVGHSLGLPVRLIPYESAGAVFAAINGAQWDLAFLAIEPSRAEAVEFTQPYVRIEGTYLVRADAPFAGVADVDRADIRISVASNAAYDLFLTRTLTHARLVRAPNPAAALDLFERREVDVSAGVRQVLDAAAADRPDRRVLPDRFMGIEQAMAVPRGRPAGAAYLGSFLQDAIASGAVRQILERHGQQSVAA